MKTLDRYVIAGLIPPFVGSLCVILFVLMLEFLLDILNLVISKGVPIPVVGTLFFYNMAWMLVTAVPMASLITAIMAYGRMAADSELTALKALGTPIWRVMMPGIYAAALLAASMVYFADTFVPEANFQVKKLLLKIHKKKPMAALRAGVFIEDFPGATLYIEKVDDKAGKIFGVTMFEKMRTGQIRTIAAPYGEVRYDDATDAVSFTLFDGTIHELDSEDKRKYTIAHFEKQVLNITDLGTKLGSDAESRRGDRELTGDMLSSEIIQQRTNIVSAREQVKNIAFSATDTILNGGRQYRRLISQYPERRAMLVERRRLNEIRRLKTEIESAQKRIVRMNTERQKRYSLAFACLLFLFLGAPVGAWARKGGLGIAVGLSFGFFVMYWAFLIGGEEFANRGYISPFIGLWLGNFVLTSIGALILYRITFDARFSGLGWVHLLTERFRKRKQKA